MEALLVIDMINDFMAPGGALYCGDAVRGIIPEVRGLLDRFRAEGKPVVFLCDRHAEDDPEFLAFPRHAVAGTWGAEVVAELAPRPGEVVVPKTRFSGFYRTDLEEVLRARGVERVWLTGVCTSICVMDTAAGAFYRGFAVRVPRRAVGDFDPEMHEFALRRMERIYRAEIVP